ncbi:MAG: hypothetical protein HZC55_09480 [Verrucomicrobia bacterium]|nr:hypothetical protein [Verrucomicrobiota bacterium]
MNDAFLRNRLERVARRYRWFALWRKLAACWAGAALITVAVAWVQGSLGQVSPAALPVVLILVIVTVAVVVVRHLLAATDYRWLAQKIERKHPDLDGVLLTAVQQTPGGSEEQGYLQYRVIQEATIKSQEQDWRDVLPPSRFLIGQVIHLLALALFGLALTNLRVTPILGEAPRWVGNDGVSVTPGDTKVEKGDSLVVLARFAGALPPTVGLVVRENGVPPRTIPLVKSLADPVFGGSVLEVASDFTYHLEYRGQRTRDFTVKVFEHPRLLRADVALKFPDYTRLAPKRIEDTRRVSAVEGTQLDFALQLNKPVKIARLIGRGEKKEILDLSVVPGQPAATLAAHVPKKSGTYDLQLVDEEGRANKVAAPFVIDVQPNRPPEIRLALPRGDVRPSALEEVTFDGTVWDDFGTPAYGIAYALAGGEPKFVELGRDGGPKEKRLFGHVLSLEALGAKPDDLVSWYAWADDIGPDGQVRRTSGDLYFAEVRPFDEIFRESQNQESGEQQEQQGNRGQQARRLSELQKQIISATWKLQREGAKPGYPADAKVVLESQEQALAQAGEAAEEARSPRQQALWKSVTQEMEKAIERLKDAAQLPAPLAQALPAEQAAYQALLKLQARETNVTRRNRQQGGGGGGQQGNQRQLDQLDLQQSENRYETQRVARSPQNKERREQLAVLNRLQELARRQQDINDRLKELQTALQEAKTEQQKEDIRKRLKRLEEEQRQMLADADELRQRMDRAENQSAMTQQRQQLDQTREDIQKAADAAADGSVSSALASGTRAQRQLQEMREDLRKQNSSQFSEELRQMRSEARDLAQRQEELSRKLDQLADGQSQRKTLGESGERKEVLDQLAEQKERTGRLLERATQVSEQAENTEPLLARQLYDSIRKVTQDDANSVRQIRSELLGSGMMTRDMYDRLQKAQDREEGGRAFDLTRDLLREGLVPQARQAGQRARGEIEDLKRGVERAAESVLGDDAEQLKLARSELDALTDQLQREIAQAGRPPGSARDGESGRSPGEQPGSQPGREQPGERTAQAGESRPEGSEPGQRGQPGQEGQRGAGNRGERAQQMAGNDGRSPGEQPGQEGQQPGQGQGGRGESRQEGRTAAAGGEGGGGLRRLEERDGQARDPRNRGALAEANRTRTPQIGGGGSNELGGLSVDLLSRGGDRWGGGLGGAEFGPVYRGPLTGDEFNRWTERLRDVEELVDSPEWRNAIAAARERARLIRRDFRQDLKKPDWTVVELQIVKPLVEVRNRVAEELARRDSKDSLTPIDRDPVPNRYAESVRRYYEELGKDK